MPQNQLFNTFWHGEKLSTLEKACMRSFLEHQHMVRVFTYLRVEMPPGVIIEDASNILPYDRFFTFEGSPSAFSNIFRYKLLAERGGWWVDTDILCLRKEIPECDYYWAFEEQDRINSAILKFPPGDPVCWRLLRLSEEESKNLTHWGQLGPDLATKLLSRYTPTKLCGSTEDVYPVHWVEVHLFWLPEFLYEIEERIKTSTFLHLWQSMFKRLGVDSNDNPPFGSFLYKLYSKYSLRSFGDATTNSARPCIRRYLEAHQCWFKQYWGNRLRRDSTRLYPLQEYPNDELLKLQGQLNNAITSLRELEKTSELQEKARGALEVELARLRSNVASGRWLTRKLIKNVLQRLQRQ
jgi:hypothetical protein